MYVHFCRYGTLAEDCEDSDTCWSPFLERKDVLVWRREHPDHRGLYAYKMYGRFDDVTAKEFLEVQMDLSEFRLQWDISTAQCHIINESKEVTHKSRVMQCPMDEQKQWGFDCVCKSRQKGFLRLRPVVPKFEVAWRKLTC